MRQRLKKYTQILCLCILTFIVILSSIALVSASSGFVAQGNETTLWYGGINKDLAANPKDTYPYSNDSLTIEKVGFDILYGTKRGFVMYTGEVPFAGTHNADGDANDGFEGIPYNPVFDKSHSYLNSAQDYWGTDADAITVDPSSLQELEELAGTNTSLRLYSLLCADKHTGFGAVTTWLSNAVYDIFKFFAWIASLVCTLIIRLKNIDIIEILNALHLDEVSDVIFEALIADKNGGKIGALSPLAIIATCVLLVSIAAYTYRYVTGKDKMKDFWTDILSLFLIGILLISTGLTGKQVELGTTLAEVTNELIQAVEDPSMDMWQTKTANGSATMDLMYSEISKVNKAFIDLQICTQFGVSDIKDLDYSNLSTADTDILTEYYPTDPENGEPAGDEFTNLGYYYWFANSPAASKTENNTVVPDHSMNQAAKMNQIVTYLQASYDATTDTAKKANILNMQRSLTKPAVGDGIMTMLALTACYIMLAIALFKFALHVVTAKMSLLVGVIAMPVGGLLIFTTNKKLVQTGKGIIGIIMMSIIRVAVYSIFFDLILNIVATILDAEFIRMLIVGALLFLMCKFNGAIEVTFEKFLSNVERTIAPQARTFKADAKQFGRRTLSKMSQNFEREGTLANKLSHKTVGYDEDGKPIKQKTRFGIYAKSAVNTASDWMNESWMDREGGRRTIKESRKELQQSKESANEQIANSAERRRRDILADAEDSLNASIDAAYKDANKEIIGIRDSVTGSYDRSKLNDDELDKLDEVQDINTKLTKFTNEADYKLLRKKLANNEELTEKELVRYNSYKEKERALQSEHDKLKFKLDEDVKTRLTNEAFYKHHDEINANLEKVELANKDIINKNGYTVDNSGKTSGDLSEKDFEKKKRIEHMREDFDSNGKLKGGLNHYQLEKDEEDAAKDEFDIHSYENAIADKNTAKVFKTHQSKLANADRLAEDKDELTKAKQEQDAKNAEHRRKARENKQAQAKQHVTRETRPQQVEDRKTKKKSSNKRNKVENDMQRDIDRARQTMASTVSDYVEPAASKSSIQQMEPEKPKRKTFKLDSDSSTKEFMNDYIPDLKQKEFGQSKEESNRFFREINENTLRQQESLQKENKKTFKIMNDDINSFLDKDDH